MEQTCLEVLGEKLEDKLKDLHLHQGFACGPNYYIQAGKKRTYWSWPGLSIVVLISLCFSWFNNSTQYSEQTWFEYD